MKAGPNDVSRRTFLATTGAIGTGAMAASWSMAAEPIPLAPPDKQPADLRLPEVVDRKLGWAIVGLGQLALGEILPAFAQCTHSQPVALVSGHAAKAKQVAAAYGIPAKGIYSYETYDRLADNPDVDVVYIVLPNSMHAEYTIRAHQAGKHVLCEKPMATSVDECAQMISAAKRADKKLMIAYRLRYEPFNMKAIELCHQKKLGDIKLIVASNTQNVSAPNIRLSRRLGGGPLGDVGVYCLNACRYLTGKEPLEVMAYSQQPGDDPRFREVPESVTFALRFPDGVLAHCGCGFGAAESRFYRVEGTQGVLELDNAFAYRGQKLRVRTSQEDRQLKLQPVNHFAAEMDHFSQALLASKDPRTPGIDGLRDMRAMAAIEESARTGKAIRLGAGAKARL